MKEDPETSHLKLKQQSSSTETIALKSPLKKSFIKEAFNVALSGNEWLNEPFHSHLVIFISGY
jgi:hypothetical protein